MAGTIVVDRIESDGSYASTINVASRVNFAGGMQVGGQDATFGGRRNKIINGDFKVDQKRSYTELNPANIGYNIDMWYNINSASGKVKQQTVLGGGPAGFNTYHAVTSLSAYTPGASEEFGLIQRLEGYNVVDLAYGTSSAKTTTLSFWVYASQAGTYPVGLYGLFGAGSSQRTNASTYTVNQANTWERKTVTFVGDTANSFTNKTNSFTMEIRFGFGGGANASTSTLNQWQAGNFSNVSGTVQLVSNNAAYVYLTGVQFEIGSSATNFEFRSYADELTLCQRYFQYGTNFTSVGVNSTTQYGSLTFPVEMRTTPSIGTTGAIATTDGVAADYAQSSGHIIIDSGRVTSKAVSFQMYNFSGLTAYRMYQQKPGNGGQISLSAEL